MAAAWSTFHCEQRSFVYGIAMARLPAPGVPISSALEAAAVPRVRVLRRDGGEPRPELGDVPALLDRRPALDVRDRALDRRVLVRRHRELALDLGAGEDVADRREDLVRIDARRVGVVERDAGLRGEQRPVLRFGPAHQHHVGVTAGHRFRARA